MHNLFTTRGLSFSAQPKPIPLRIAFTHNLQTARVEVQAEFDSQETVDKVTASLRGLGHEVFPVEVGGPVVRLVERLMFLAPDLIFNTAEGARGRCREAFYPALFEQLGVPFTGSDAHVCAITQSKNVTKHIVVAHGVRTPASILIASLSDLVEHPLRFPVILKPNFEGSSVGITADSVVETQRELRDRARQLLACYPAGLLAEEYIEGIDVVVPFLERASPATGGILEPASYAYRRDSERRYNIFDFDRKNAGFSDLVVEMPAKMSVEAREEAMETSRVIIEALRIRDLARIDFRLGTDGRLYFLEVNALPTLKAGAVLYAAASQVGFPTIESVLAAIIDTACKRYGLSERILGRKPHALAAELWP